MTHVVEQLRQRIADRSGTVGIYGMGYVGMPLAIAVARSGYRVLGFDIDAGRMAELNEGRSYLPHIPSSAIEGYVRERRLSGTSDFSRTAEMDVLIICVPTPITRNRAPDLTYIVKTAESIKQHARPGQLVILESTTYPGTTVEVLKPILESRGLVVGTDVFIAFSPEREDPGNPNFGTVDIPKVVGGHGAEASALAGDFYGHVVKRVVPVSNAETAEAVKLTENIFRSVNIALVNELKLVFSRMGIDVWEVIEAAKSKPFGFMPFYPGPGIGGHCIPIDPFYLTWKAREYDIATRFIELAGQINDAMPHHVVDETARALDARFGRGLSQARVLIIGIAYKKNIADMRESPSMRVFKLLEQRGTRVDFHDPHVPVVPYDHEYAEYFGRASTPLAPEVLADRDLVIVLTDHDAVDYARIAGSAKLVIDTRNAFASRNIAGDNIVKA